MTSGLRPATAREALLAELLGDVAKLLDRVETLTATLDSARQAMSNASRDVVSSVAPLEGTIARLRDAAAREAVERIAVRARDSSRSAIEQQRQAMAETARTLFAGEIAVTLSRLTAELHQAIAAASRPWSAWRLHAATAALSALGTAALVSYLLAR